MSCRKELSCHQYLNNYFDNCLEKWEEIHNLHPFRKRIMFQKYDFEYEKTLVSLRVRVAAKDTPNSFWEKFREGKKESIKELISILAFAYRKNYSYPEIKELLNYCNAQEQIENEKEVTNEELKIIEVYNTSKIAKTVLAKKEVLASDVNSIVDEWKRELFVKGLGAMVKAGYTK